MMYTLYKITGPEGRVYIGVTNNFKRRMKEHRQSPWPLGVDLRKFGEDVFSFDFEYFPTREEAEVREFELVSSDTLILGNLYNLSVGGSPKNQFTHSNPMHNKEIVDNHPNIWTTEHNPIYDPAIKQKMIESQKRKRISVDGVVYEGVREAGRQLGISRQLVVYRLKSDHCPSWFYL